MKKLVYSIFIIFSSIILLMGCSENTESDVEGYIIQVEDGRILVAQDISSVELEEMKDNTIQDWMDEGISLIYLSHKSIKNFQVGDEVRIWIDGGVDDSYPQQASLKKIEVKD